MPFVPGSVVSLLGKTPATETPRRRTLSSFPTPGARSVASYSARAPFRQTHEARAVAETNLVSPL